MQERVETEKPVASATPVKSEAERASEAKICFYTLIFLVQIAFLGAWKAYALLAPTYLN